MVYAIIRKKISQPSEETALKVQAGSIAEEGEPKHHDGYGDILKKHIPIEMITLYNALRNIVGDTADGHSSYSLWIIYGLCQIAVPLMHYFRADRKCPYFHRDLVVTTFSFLLWVAAGPGGPFLTIEWFDQQAFTSILPPLFTVLAPHLEKLNKEELATM
mmetsp:Transcript_20388/g.24325  ORF Transcript_20388/g.24325 Transcript_20388/m.24325 type:complete len:160 (+) Transcript_20388:255-734(+)